MSAAWATGAALAGRCVVVTRAEPPAGPLGTKLAAQGAEVRHWPVVQISPPADPKPLIRALENLAQYDWIVFSSPRAVTAVVGRIDGLPEGIRVAAVGDSTAETLLEEGWPVDLLPREFGSEGLVAAFSEADFAHGADVLFPASNIARTTIPDGLTGLGARVERIVAYETVAAALDSAACVADADSGRLHAVTFASPSAVSGLRAALGEMSFVRILSQVPAVVIGPTTAAALHEIGMAPAGVADPSTLDGLADAVVAVITAGSN
jgi:uroporphyrinogen III methyltransferase/synthase